MSHENFNSSQYGLRFPKNTELSQDGSSVIVNSFTGQTITVVEGINATEGYFHSPSGGGKAAPWPKMSSANHHLEQNVFVGDILVPNLNFEIRQRRHELFVVGTDSIASRIAVAPSFILIVCMFAESAHHTFKVMFIFESDMLLHERKAC